MPRSGTLRACAFGVLFTATAYQACFAQVGGPIGLAPLYGPLPGGPPPEEDGGLSDIEIGGIVVGVIGVGAGGWLLAGGGGTVGGCAKQYPEGAKVYNRDSKLVPPGCQACHGKDGTRTNEDKGIPSLVDSKMTPKQMKDIILKGRKGETGAGSAGFMPAYDKLNLTDKQLDDLINYIKCLQKLAAGPS